MVNKEIKDWIASLSGFQGGNPNAEIWVCGLEFQKSHIPTQALGKLWTVENPPFVEDDATYLKNHKERFNESIREFVETFYEKENLKLPTNIFAKDGRVFKLNLYPLPQSGSEEVYDEKIYIDSGLRTKSELRALCLEKGQRFDNFKELIQANKATLKVIVCCSRDAVDTSLLAFAESSEFYERKKQLIESQQSLENQIGKNKKYYEYCLLNSGVLLMVIPFLAGQASSLNGDLKQMARKIREIVDLKQNSP